MQSTLSIAAGYQCSCPLVPPCDKKALKYLEGPRLRWSRLFRKLRQLASYRVKANWLQNAIRRDGEIMLKVTVRNRGEIAVFRCMGRMIAGEDASAL